MNPNRSIPAGARCLSPRGVGDKFDRSLSWVWARLKSDPEFPRPVYLGPSQPVFIESELDAWLAEQVAKSSTQRQAA